MINLKVLINDFYNILNTKQTMFELLLNLTFILILLIIGVIFYWDNINRKIINTSRCKIIMNNEDNVFNMDIYNSDMSTKLLTVNYDNTKKHNVKIDCACPAGNTVNKFDVPYYDYVDQKINTTNEKYCKCDRDYKTGIDTVSKYKFAGEPFLTDYYEKIYTELPSNNNYTGVGLQFPS
jgi:hypothetical protein